MENFKRSPSKVWWAEEQPSSFWRHRSSSASPGSQDSGFSDTENSPPLTTTRDANFATSTPQKITKRVPKDLYKNERSSTVNLSGSYREKKTPHKEAVIGEKMSRSLELHRERTPIVGIPVQALSEPLRKHVYERRSSRATKNLFPTSKDVSPHDHHQHSSNVPNSNSTSDRSHEIVNKTSTSSSSSEDYTISVQLNRSAPAVLEVLKEDECVESFTREELTTDEESEADSELETLFRECLDSPRRTSTPKVGPCEKMRLRRRKLHQNVLLRWRDRVPTTTVYIPDENSAVHRWLQDMKQIYEPECLTSLQCKSISMELSEKVLTLATSITGSIRYIIHYSNVIAKEFEATKNETKYIGPLSQNLAGSVTEFIHNCRLTTDGTEILARCDALKRAKTENIPPLITKLHKTWTIFLETILVKEVSQLVDRLENPSSEFDLRATITGVTSVSLRHEVLVRMFVESGAVSSLLVLCEKCDGSSVRALILRALTTLCGSATAIRQLEKASGMQLIADVLHDVSRPEPERSEAVALLAQITAPWIEDNHSVHGLHEMSRKLIKSLTKFISSTKCCQNLLLCAAALANLTAMDTKCVKYVLLQNTLQILFEAVRQRGPRASVYLLEQVATLVANLSSVDEGRKQLTEEKAPSILLCFLRVSDSNEDVEKRLQQRAIIALSRLCGDKDAAQQLVEAGGIEKLVRICREKKERYDSDAVLVAALATLRKIADACGSSVLNAQDVQELVEPRLLDSFLAYSTQNESYV